MSDGTTHQLLGAFVGLVGYLSYKNSVNEPVGIGEAIVSAALGSLVSSLPDIIEPATNSRHREFFHSETMLAFTLALAKATLESPNLDRKQKHSILTAIAAYDGHLLQDSTTPTGLPCY